MITLRNIISNLSKGQSATSTKYILQGLQSYYESIRPKIKINGYQQDSNSTTLFFQIPSKDKPVFYDVVIWLKSIEKLTLNTQLKVFSNSPSFVYNFCYVFYKDGSLLYPEKYSNDFKILPPRVRNPWQIFSFDKHIYSAIACAREQSLKKIISITPKKASQIKTFNQKNDELTSYYERQKRK